MIKIWGNQTIITFPFRISGCAALVFTALFWSPICETGMLISFAFPKSLSVEDRILIYRFNPFENWRNIKVSISWKNNPNLWVKIQSSLCIWKRSTRYRLRMAILVGSRMLGNSKRAYRRSRMKWVLNTKTISNKYVQKNQRGHKEKKLWISSRRMVKSSFFSNKYQKTFCIFEYDLKPLFP